MNVEVLKKAEQLAAKAGHLFVATADAKGWPHVAAAGRLALTAENRVLVTEWFCPGTVANLQVNPRISLVIWDSATDVGNQLIGELEDIKDVGMLDGYAPQVEGKMPVPQIERQLLVNSDRVFEFKRAPHTDVEECE
ncbi:MAG: pyridoxamine 5'-phosphate oxidase family protein [Dehalococcoidales bacterium]